MSNKLLLKLNNSGLLSIIYEWHFSTFDMLCDHISQLMSDIRRVALQLFTWSCLFKVLEFDVGDVRIVEERTPSLSETAVPSSETKGENPMSYPASQFTASRYPKYHFKHFTDEKVKVAVNQICHTLGYHGNLSVLTDHFLDLFHESKLYQKQAVYILTELVVGFSSRDTLARESNPLDGKAKSCVTLTVGNFAV